MYLKNSYIFYIDTDKIIETKMACSLHTNHMCSSLSLYLKVLNKLEKLILCILITT
jgi:hypothetical protein